MILATTETISGKELEVLGLVKGSTIQTVNVARDIGASLKTLVGGELTKYNEMMNNARALATNPEVVFFDEPTSALDPELTGEVLTVIKQLADEGRTMIVVTHEMEFARKVATRVVFMEDGEIVEENIAREFFENPQKDRTKEFIYKSSTWASTSESAE